MNDIKKTFVSFEDVKYSVNKEAKVVVCIIKARLNNTDFITNNCFIYGDYINKIKNRYPEFYSKNFTVVGVAKCHPKDTFDEILGKRIAESKAKAEAFMKASKYLDYSTSLLIKEIRDLDMIVSINCEDAAYHETEHIKYLQKQNNK